MKISEEKIEKINLFLILMTLLVFLTHRYFRGLTILWVLSGAFYIKKYGYKKTGFEVPLLIYIISLFLSLSFSLDFKHSLKEIYRHSFGFVPPFFISQLTINKRLKEKYINWIILTLAIYFFIVTKLMALGKIPSYFYQRYIPLQIMPVEFCFIAGVICIYLWSGFLKEKKIQMRLLNILGVLLIGYVLLKTQTRGAWLGVIFSVILIYLVNSKNLKTDMVKMFGFLGGIGGVFYVFRNSPKLLPIYSRILSIGNMQTDRSNTGRLVAWKIGKERFLQRKLTGWGYKAKQVYDTGEFGGYQKLDHPHSDYISYLVNTGIIGLLSYLYLMFTIILKSFQNREDTCWLTMFGITIYTLTYGVVENLFNVTNSLFLFLFFLSICLIKESKDEN